MFCHHCGQAIQANYQYCSGCGAQLPAAGVVAEPSRMQGHVRILAIVYVIYSLLGLIGSVGLLAALTAIGAFLSRVLGVTPGVDRLLQGLIGSLGLLMVLESVAGLIAGFGLMQYRPWARTLTILLSVINLLHIPFGTAIGLYGLWVLISAEGERHYRQMALVAG